ncbi:hypothetical protein [Streptomyces sp. NPDC101249]|jgi:hypothetical protein|uniref:hypothetical protein n=1 Tax=unclassified Streptomyces TaxID=2593676 RepID=UPI0038140F38
MGTRIRVSVAGPAGLDELHELRAELDRTTGLSWQEGESGSDGRVLSGGVSEIILVAVTGKLSEMAVTYAVDAARKVVARHQARRLDPGEATLTTEPLPADPADDEPDPPGRTA